MSNTLLNQARQHCESKGARFTAIREKVYQILLENDGATGAYDLLDRLRETEDSAKPATIYRALDFLLQYGLAHKIESSNAFMACHHFDCSHPVQLLICEQCGNVEEILSSGLQQALEAQANAQGFKVARQTVEAHGLCQKCQ